MHSNSKAGLTPKSAIRHFWSADRHFQSAEWHTLGFWLDNLRVTLKHILFDFLEEGRVLVCILIV